MKEFLKTIKEVLSLLSPMALAMLLTLLIYHLAV
mgnify:FL=1